MQASDWKRIDTAPKDGTPIIGWNISRGAHETRSTPYGIGSIGHAEQRPNYWNWEEPINNWHCAWYPTHWHELTTPQP